jgi:hypothetical protein
MPDESAVRDRRAFYGCYLLLWGMTVLPFLLLGFGFAGSAESVLRSWIVTAAEGNPVSIVTLLATLPLLTVPYWLWAESRRITRPLPPPDDAQT